MAGKEILTICAVGDVGVMREDPESIFALSAPILREADIAFCQLERILSERADPAYTQVLVWNPAKLGQALSKVGFDVISTAGNHHMDAGVEPFIDTLDVLKQNNILPVGVGRNIVEARTPALVERKGTRVAFLGYSSIIPRCEVPWEATPNRPGCAPMFISTFYEPEDWQPGSPPKVITIADKEDLAAMQEDVRRAKAQADIVIMSIHWGIHHLPAMIAMYEYEVGHAAIEAGVDLVLGHHAHILKGIEVYKGKVIFHNLGNFATDRPRKTKPGIHARWSSLSPVESGDYQKGWAYEVEPGWKEYPLPPDERKTVIAKCTISEKKIERISFLPCMINKIGQPEPLSREDKRSGEVYQYIEWCCKDQGLDTRFSREGDEVVVRTWGEE